jgi:hypothetical protein
MDTNTNHEVYTVKDLDRGSENDGLCFSGPFKNQPMAKIFPKVICFGIPVKIQNLVWSFFKIKEDRRQK